MENKYYTPSLEEYFIGMEFYVFRNNTWEKNILTEEGFRCILNFTTNNKFCNKWGISDFQLDPTPIRIKYLDKEDIESLGFILDAARASGFHFYLNNYELAQPYLDSRCYLKQINNKEILFNGIIKNKSELKRLLKQLGVNE